MGIKYKIIDQKHSEYDHEYVEKLELLYKGGKDLLEEAHHFIPKLPQEHPVVYQSRLDSASYHNYMQEIVMDFVSNLFSKQLSIIPAADASNEETPGELPQGSFYNEFSKDADLSYNSFSQVMMHMVREAMVLKKAYVGVDFPAYSQELSKGLIQDELNELSLEDEEELGLSRAYLYDIPVLSVINWEKDAYGKFSWLILKSETPVIAPLQEVKLKRIHYKYWFKDNGKVKFQCYEIELPINKTPKADQEIPLIEEGEVSFSRIPILELCLPDGLWIGNLLYSPVVEHFRQRSSLIFAENRSLFAVPFYRLSSELDNIGTNAKANRGEAFRRDLTNKGFLVGTDKDELDFIEPEGKAFVLLNSQLKELVDEIHRVSHQMAASVASTGSASARSGISKVQDNRAKEMVLGAFAQVIKDFVKEIYECVSTARKEDIEWQVIGMQDYKVIERDTLINELKILPLIKAGIPSKTQLKQYLFDLSSRLTPDMSPNTQIVVQQEISDAVDNSGMDELYSQGMEPDPGSQAKPATPKKKTVK